MGPVPKWCCSYLKDAATSGLGKAGEAFGIAVEGKVPGGTKSDLSTKTMGSRFLHECGSNYKEISYCPWCGTKLDSIATVMTPLPGE